MFYRNSNALFVCLLSLSYVVCAFYTCYKGFGWINKSELLVAVQKRKHGHQTLREKAKALQDIEKGLSNKEVAAKYNVPKKYYIHMGQK